MQKVLVLPLPENIQIPLGLIKMLMNEIELLDITIVQSMKQFNSFAANTSSLSDYYSPKATSQRVAFPSIQNSRQEFSRAVGGDPLRVISNVPAQYNKNQRHDKRMEALARAELENLDQSIESVGLESRVSLLLSDVSVPVAGPIQFDPPRLFSLENNITQNILGLREEKITLMQELSKILDTKNLYEHYLLKASREKDEQDTNQGSFRDNGSQRSPIMQKQDDHVPLHISAPILKRNQQLHLRLKELQIKEEIFGARMESNEDDGRNQRLLQQIIQVRELNSNLKNQMATKVRPSSDAQQSRLVTFLPQDRQKHFESRVSPRQQYQQLVDKYKKLQSQSNQNQIRLTKEESDLLESLRNENRALIQEAEHMLRAKDSNTNALSSLQRKLQENQRQKEIFMRELESFKLTMKQLKIENEKLKQELSK